MIQKCVKMLSRLPVSVGILIGHNFRLANRLVQTLSKYKASKAMKGNSLVSQRYISGCIQSQKTADHNDTYAKQGRIHGRISHLRLGRGSVAKTARITPNKSTDRPIDLPTNGLT